MKRSKGQSQGRPLKFGSRKVQTTVRIPENVLEYLKDHYGILQRAIDALLIIPTLQKMKEQKLMAERKKWVAADLVRDQDTSLDTLVSATRAELDAEDNKHNGGPSDA